jgi:hypothetical protein
MAKDEKPKDVAADLPFKMIKSFFPDTTEKTKDDISVFVKTAGALSRLGVSISHLREALAIMIGIMSTKLGDPVPMVITEDEGAGALELLHTCLNLVPEDSWVVLQPGKKSSSDENHFKGKTIVGYDADSAKDLLSRLLMEIELSSKTSHVKAPHHKSAPSSFVVISKNLNHPILQNRYVTRIHINADQESKTQRLGSLVNQASSDIQKQFKIESACLRTLFNRIRACPVDIDFADQIVNQKAIIIQNFVPYYDSALRLLRNITRINNSPPLKEDELYAAFLGLDPEDLISEEEKDKKQPLKSTKVDYFYFLSIFGDMFKIENDFITVRQRRIYNAIIKQDLEHQKRFIRRNQPPPTDQEMLYKLHESSGFSDVSWLTREKILDLLQKDGGEIIAATTLHNEIQVLLKRQLIAERKVPGKKNKSAYAATQVIEGQSLFATKPSDIVDSTFNKSEVEVIDILERTMVRI